MNNATLPVASRRPLWLRLVKAIVALGLGLTLSFIAGLAMVGGLSFKSAVFETDSDGVRLLARTAVALLLLIIVFIPLGLSFVALRRRWLTWTALLAGWLAVIPVLRWLSWDESVLQHPLSFEELCPTFPDAAQSYALLMRYSRQHPNSDAREFDQKKLPVLWKVRASLQDPAKWAEFVRANRTPLESEWASLAAERRWLDQLNAFERIGDLTLEADSADVPTFRVWETLANGVAAITTVRALDGHGDEAIATLANDA